MAGSTKRKDSKGRLLRSGETERKDGRFMFRYNDLKGNRQTIYARDLHELRRKEALIQNNLKDGIDYRDGEITVIELLERYVALKQGNRHHTKVGYGFVLNLVKKENFGYRRISTIKVSDAKLWFQKLQADGRGYSTITSVRGVCKPAFQMAWEEDVIRRNPFAFSLAGVIENTTVPREALTPEEQKRLMDFLRTDSYYRRYYDEFNLLLHTGLRIGELCGLTISDLDFDRRRVRVERQLIKERGGVYHIQQPKSKCGIRMLPMTDEVYRSLKNILRSRPKPQKELMVDGHTGFLLLDKNQNPYVGLHLDHHLKRAMDKYRRTHTEPLPVVTPHVLRHTFCTNMANAGMDVKSLQYLMGHSDAGITMNTYTHASFDHAEKAMLAIVRPKGEDGEKKTG